MVFVFVLNELMQNSSDPLLILRAYSDLADITPGNSSPSAVLGCSQTKKIVPISYVYSPEIQSLVNATASRPFLTLVAGAGCSEAVACAKCLAFPLLSRHSETAPEFSVNDEESSPSSHSARPAMLDGEKAGAGAWNLANGRSKRGFIGMALLAMSVQ